MLNSSIDPLLNAVDSALRTLFAPPRAALPCPVSTAPGGELSATENAHAGEVCAQALYTAQALATKNEALRGHFQRAIAEESNHLAWTKQRLDELGARPSLLNPLWYAGAFGLGLLAGRLGDRVSLGFVLETEAQVEALMSAAAKVMTTTAQYV